MLIIPAVDIRGGRCVRLYQGDPEKESVYFEDPLEAALLWQSKGARLIHVVDLDAAMTGEPVNRGVVERIIRSEVFEDPGITPVILDSALQKCANKFQCNTTDLFPSAG